MPTKKSVLQTVLGILGTTPDSEIKSNAWLELLKLQLALKGLASAIDSLREKNKVVSSGQEVPYQTIGNVEYALYIQDMTVIQAVASSFIRRNSGVYFTPDGAGGIRANPVKLNIKAEAYSKNGVSAGSTGEFILKGFISYNYDFTGTYYSMNGITNKSHNGYAGDSSHHMVSTYPDGFGDNLSPIGAFAWYTAYDFWSEFNPKQKGPYYNYVGVALGNSEATVYSPTYLIYFNPERY